MRRSLTALAAAATVLVAGGCGGDDGEDLVEEGPLRDCLAEAGLVVAAPDLAASAGLGSASADFRATAPDGSAVDVIVLGNARKAERTAADIAAARAGLGSEGGQQLVTDRNAIAVPGSEPGSGALEAVEECLGA